MEISNEESRPKTPTLDVLSTEFTAIRAGMVAAAEKDVQFCHFLAEHVAANDTFKAQVLSRLERGEEALRQLRHPATSVQGYSAPPGSYPRDLSNRTRNSGGIALHPSASNLISPRPGQFDDSGFHHRSFATSSKAVTVRQGSSRTQDKTTQLLIVKDRNIDLLPMVIESILAERMVHEKKGSLRACNHIGKEGEKSLKCQQDCFDVQCFKADHFEFCYRHGRVITGSNLSCTHVKKHECIRVYWEDHPEWETVALAAIAAKNIGFKGVPNEVLKMALLPPQRFPQAYASAHE
ncbi:hypothetical protein NX059_007601 [Plenodomus lindquistii]|nr:hypothetical protein NX059_007601 [Plenodomus lindquistii]